MYTPKWKKLGKDGGLQGERRGKEKGLSIGEQIGPLFHDCKVDTTIPSHFAELLSVRDKLGPMQDGIQRDALRCIIAMRNNVIHPTHHMPACWTTPQWAEASQVALDSLRLSILHMVGYEGDVRTTTQKSIWEGSLAKTPWS